MLNIIIYICVGILIGYYAGNKTFRDMANLKLKTLVLPTKKSAKITRVRKSAKKV